MCQCAVACEADKGRKNEDAKLVNGQTSSIRNEQTVLLILVPRRGINGLVENSRHRRSSVMNIYYLLAMIDYSSHDLL